MMIPSLLIVTDRGGLRAFKVEPNPNRAPGLHLLDSFEAAETHGRYQDKVSDQAGRLQGGTHGAANTGGGADEHGTIDAENRRRACKHIAERINELVQKRKARDVAAGRARRDQEARARPRGRRGAQARWASRCTRTS